MKRISRRRFIAAGAATAAAVDGASERPLKLDIDAQRRWRINGLTFDMGAAPITVKRDPCRGRLI